MRLVAFTWQSAPLNRDIRFLVLILALATNFSLNSLHFDEEKRPVSTTESVLLIDEKLSNLPRNIWRLDFLPIVA